MTPILPIAEKDIAAASRVLSDAFMNDPLQQYVFPDAAERREKSPAHFEAVIRYGWLFGQVHTTPDMQGIAVWLPPGHTEVTPEKAEKAGLGNLPVILGEAAADRFFGVMDFLDPFHSEDAAQPHWYTMVIGVHPSFCGQGYGRALMQAVIKKAAAEGTAVYLETAGPSNIPFYRSLGFTLLRELTDPASGLPLWTFKY